MQNTFNRRRFITAAGALLSLNGTSAFSSANSVHSSDVKLGVASYSLRKLSRTQAIAALKELSGELGGPLESDEVSDVIGEDAPADPSQREQARTAEQYLEDLGKLVRKLPSGKGLSKHVAGSVSWSFVEDRGFGIQTVHGRRQAGSP